MGPVAPVIAVVVGVISAATAVVGGIMQYQSQQRQAGAARRQGEAQAAAAAENARAAKAAAAYEEYQHRFRTSKLIGEQRAKFGKAGVIMEGTPLAILEDTAYQSELDAMAIKYRGDAALNRGMAEADLYRQAGETTAQAYSSQAGTSLLTGFTTGLGRGLGAYDAYRDYSRNKAAGGLS